MSYMRDISVVDYTYNKFNPRSCDFDIPDFVKKFIDTTQEHSESLKLLISKLENVDEIHVYNLVNNPEMMCLEVYLKGENIPLILRDTNLEGKLSQFIRRIYFP